MVVQRLYIPNICYIIKQNVFSWVTVSYLFWYSSLQFYPKLCTLLKEVTQKSALKMYCNLFWSNISQISCKSPVFEKIQRFKYFRWMSSHSLFSQNPHWYSLKYSLFRILMITRKITLKNCNQSWINVSMSIRITVLAELCVYNSGIMWKLSGNINQEGYPSFSTQVSHVTQNIAHIYSIAKYNGGDVSNHYWMWKLFVAILCGQYSLYILKLTW